MAEMQRFPYQSVVNARGEITLRPQLPLTLSHLGHAIQTVGLLDTGADVNVLPYELGVALGAIWDNQTVGIELSGNLAAYEARGLVLTATIGSTASVRLGFAWTRQQNIPLLLGQVNFFAEFDVCFYRSQRAFEVRRKA